ncbi:MAG: response regulator transcription factor [Candidatus Limnocylindrales bacterium]
MTRILVVEDEPDIALGLLDDLTRHGYEVETVADGDSALSRASAEKWDLILLDVMLPNVDGFEVCSELRRRRVRIPIILLTAKAQEAEKVLGLEMGAADYVTKPFSPRELRARIKAVLRRGDDDAMGVERFGDIEVDFDRAEVRRQNELVEVTALELRLLKALLARRGRVLTRAQLIDLAWESGTNVSDRVVDTHILNLRKKVEPVPSEPRFIRGVRGIGYRFDG